MKNNLKVAVSTLRVFPKGIIPVIMARGILLPEAIKIARRDCLYENVVENLIVNEGRTLVYDFLKGESRTGLEYHGLGTYDTTPTITDTQLTSEASRNAITALTIPSYKLIASTYFSAAQSTFYIKECGLFCNGATSAPNTGDMFNHYLQAFDNSDGLNDVTFEYTFGI